MLLQPELWLDRNVDVPCLLAPLPKAPPLLFRPFVIRAGKTQERERVVVVVSIVCPVLSNTLRHLCAHSLSPLSLARLGRFAHARWM